MFARRPLISGSLFVFLLAGTALAQESRGPIETPGEPAAPIQAAPLVTATATAARVRFVSPGTVVQLRLEVYNEAGQKLFDTELHGGNVLDWHLQDGAGARLPAGTYACVLTTKSLSGRLSQRVGQVTVNAQKAMVEGATQLSVAQQQTIGPVEGSAALTVVQEIAAEAITAVTHDGNDGRITSTRGALTFGTGDVFAGNEVERMRITPEGNVGIGTDKPEAKLDVVGDIRSTGVLRLDKGIEFADGTMQTTGLSGRMDSEGNLVPNVAGTGTQGRLAKWTDNAGTLGNSVVTEAVSGKLGIGTVSPNYEITLFGNDVGLQLISPASGTTANDGFRFGVSSTNHAFLWNTEATDLYFGTTATERMRIKAAGNVGIGTSNPVEKLDVAGHINSSTQYMIGGNRVLSNGGSNNLFAGVGTGTITTGNNNSFFGFNVGPSNTFGANNSFFGAQTGFVNTGSENSFFGRIAGFRNTSGSSNAFFGVEAGDFNTSGSGNSAFGTFAGMSNTTEHNNTFVGYSSNGVAGITNATAIGHRASVTQSNSLVLGSINGQNGATSDTNVGIGKTNPTAKLDVVGNINTTTQYNIASSRVLSVLGTGNLFAGVSAGAVATGSNNAFFGASAGQANTTGGSNSFFGGSAGLSNTTEHNNTFVGSVADGAAGITNATAVGYRAKVTQSDSLVLGSINGQNGASSDTNVGIGTTAPKTKLHVAGGSVYIAQASGLIVKSPNGTCWVLAVDDFGVLTTSAVTCP